MNKKNFEYQKVNQKKTYKFNKCDLACLHMFQYYEYYTVMCGHFY